jgi:hypothetical protein
MEPKFETEFVIMAEGKKNRDIKSKYLNVWKIKQGGDITWSNSEGRGGVVGCRNVMLCN